MDLARTVLCRLLLPQGDVWMPSHKRPKSSTGKKHWPQSDLKGRLALKENKN